MRCSSRISTPALRAAAWSGRIRPLPALTFSVARIGQFAGVDHRPVLDRDLHGAQRRDADLVPDLVRQPVDDLHAVRQQEFERRHAVVGEGADDLAVVVAIGRKAVGLDHRPVGQVAEQQVGRIRDAVFFLVAGAAAERQIAARGDGVAADMVFRLDDDDRAACFARDDRGRQAGGAGADDDDVGLAMPMVRQLTMSFHVGVPYFHHNIRCVMAGLVPAIHVFGPACSLRRGCPRHRRANGSGPKWPAR